MLVGDGGRPMADAHDERALLDLCNAHGLRLSTPSRARVSVNACYSSIRTCNSKLESAYLPLVAAARSHKLKVGVDPGHHVCFPATVLLEDATLRPSLRLRTVLLTSYTVHRLPSQRDRLKLRPAFRTQCGDPAAATAA